MKKLLLLSLLYLALSSCNETNVEIKKEIAAEPVNTSEIDSLMTIQQNDWNSGNIDGFMKTYWNSDSLLFIGKKGVTNGWQKTLDNYKKSYPDKAAMGRLHFEIIKHEPIANAAVYSIGKWTVFRTADTLGGHFTLLWKKIDGNWEIVADHTS